jgi:PAS domain S-box-containing protein
MPRPTPLINHLDAKISVDMIRRTSLLVAVSASIVAGASIGILPGAELYSSATLTYPSVLLSLVGWVIVALSKRLNALTLATGLIYSVQLVALLALFSFGSIRGAGSVLFLATTVAAGIFLGQRALIISLLTGVTALGAVTYAEMTGAIAPQSLQVSVFTWITHVSVLTCVALAVFYAWQLNRKAYEEQFEALEENKRLTAERDRGLERFARIFQSSPSPMVAQSGTTGKIVDVNPAFERCYGRRKEDVVGQTDEMLWAMPAQREQHLQDIRTHKRAERYDACGLRADGSTFDAHIHSEWASESEDSLVISTITDTSELNGVLRRLRRSEERFAKAFNFSPLNLIITRESDDTVVEINRTSHLLANVPDGSLSGLAAAQVVPWFTPTGREVFFNRLHQQGYLHGFETHLLRPDGSSIDAKIWAEMIELDEGACVLSCVVDTTDEKRREAMLRDIAKGMTGHTAQAFFQALTEHMTHALGADMVLIGELTDAQTIQTLSVSRQGLNVPNFAFSITGKLCERSMRQREPLVLESGVREGDKWNNLDGSPPFEGVICQALHDMDGNPIGLLNALWTHPVEPNADTLALMSIFASRANAEMRRLRTERQIEQLNETLEQRVHQRTSELLKLNAELDSFAYSISHDLKSPLRAIDGFTQLLSERLDGRLDTEERHLMGRVLGATHRMATLMADLLALARVSQVPMERERLNLSELAEEVIRQKLQQQPRPQLRWAIEPGILGIGDRNLVRSVLEHLIDNAIKYTRDQRQPLIEFGQVQANAPDKLDAPVQYFVKDNGAGFSMEHADKLFKPFQRLHMPDAGFEGTGIGLATVRRIVERHGGAIEGKAQVDQGAEFRFSLNGAQPQLAEPTPPSEHQKQTP